MDIKQLEYFVEIVKCNFNLSAASKNLRVSQPALSKVIKSFENNENIQLFERYNGRLQNLTPSGKIFYQNALHLTESYQRMFEEIRELSVEVRGKIRIGIPPLILGIAFPQILSSLISNNPHIEFEIIEAGSVELEKGLLAKSIDLAVLIRPTDFEEGVVEEYLIQEGELSAFMSSTNPLAKKQKLLWSDLAGQTLALLDASYKIHHKVKRRLDIENIQPKKIITSTSWDFLLMSTRKSDFITVFQAAIQDIFLLKDITAVSFYDPIPWQVSICRLKKKKYTQIEKFVLKSIVSHFATSENGNGGAK